VHGAKNNQPDALNLHNVNLARRLSGLAGEDEIGQILKLERAVLAVLAPAAKGAFPKDALIRLSENEPGSFIEDVMVEQQKFLQTADVVGVAVGDVVVVETADVMPREESTRGMFVPTSTRNVTPFLATIRQVGSCCRANAEPTPGKQSVNPAWLASRMRRRPSVEPVAIVWVTFIPRVQRCFAGEIGILFAQYFATKKGLYWY
jgi:hypothetical protein